MSTITETGDIGERPQPPSIEDQQDQNIVGDVSTLHSADADTTSFDKELQITKLKLELRKLRDELKKGILERKALSRQLSWGTVVLEWVKAGSVFGALVGVAATLYLGQQQTKIAQQQVVSAREAADNARQAAERQSDDAEKNRAADRFDKALTRLAEKGNAQSRMSGVAGLKLFLGSGNKEHQRDAMYYLITALGHEDSVDVRQAIVDSLSDVDHFDQDVKNDALTTAINVDRDLTKLQFLTLTKNALDKRNEFLKTEQISISDETAFESLPFIEKLKINNFGTLLSFDQSHQSDDIGTEEDILDIYVQVINKLLSAGALNKSKDWSNIYCEGCKFSSMVDLSNTRFDGSFLGNSDFSYVNLTGATFTGADLGGAIFYHSNLTNANFKMDVLSRSDALTNLLSRANYDNVLPYFACSILDGTVLDGVPLISIEHSFIGKSISSSVTVPNMSGAKVTDRTKLNSIGLFMNIRFDGDFYNALDEAKRRNFEDDIQRGMLSNYLGGFGTAMWRSDSSIATKKSENKDVILDVGEKSIGSVTGPRTLKDWLKPLIFRAFGINFWMEMPLTRHLYTVSLVREPKNAMGPHEVPRYIDCSQPSPPAFEMSTTESTWGAAQQE